MIHGKIAVCILSQELPCSKRQLSVHKETFFTVRKWLKIDQFCWMIQYCKNNDIILDFLLYELQLFNPLQLINVLNQ